MPRKVNINIYFEQDTIEKLDDLKNTSAGKYFSRSDIVRVAVEEFLDRRERDPDGSS